MLDAVLGDVPDDCRLIPVAKAALGLDMGPRRLAELLGVHHINVVQLRERGRAVRLSDLRRLVRDHEVRP